MTGEKTPGRQRPISDTPLTREEFAEYLAAHTQEHLAKLSPAERAKRLVAIKQSVADAKAEQAR